MKQSFFAITVVQLVLCCACLGEAESTLASGELVFELGPFELSPGEELNTCAYLQLPEGMSPYVVDMRQQNSGYVHHFGLYPNNLILPQDMQYCPPLSALVSRGTILYLGTRDQGPATLPSGVAFELDLQQQMLMDLHLLNASDVSVTETMTLTLTLGDADQSWIRAGTFAFTNPDIEIPAQSEGRTEHRCVFPQDVNVISMSSHTHERGRMVTAHQWDGENVVGDEVYRSSSWADPAVVYYEQPLRIPTGHGIHYQCQYFNPDPEPVFYGATADDEMCDLFGHYYPGRDSVLFCR